MGISRYPLNNDETGTIDARLLYVTYSKFENDWPSLVHTHPFAELCYIKSGKGIYMIEDSPYPVRELRRPWTRRLSLRRRQGFPES